MAWIHPAAVEHRRQMYTRHDAWRFAPHGTPEGKMPGWLDPSMTRVRWKEAQEEEARAAFEAEVKRLQDQQDRLCEMFAEIKYEFAWRKLLRKYSPNQPRVASGNPDGGQWTRDGQGQSGSAPVNHNPDNGRTRLADATSRVGTSGQPILSDAIPVGARYAEAARPGRYSVNLDEEDYPRGIGHTQRDHVGKSDAELIGKLNEDWQRRQVGRFEITEYRSAQGSFLSRESATDFVNRTLEDNKQTVDRVASGQEAQATLEKRFGYVTGKEAFRSYGDAEPYIRDTYGVRMVIRHDLRSENGYRVYTAYPVNEYLTKRR